MASEPSRLQSSPNVVPPTSRASGPRPKRVRKQKAPPPPAVQQGIVERAQAVEVQSERFSSSIHRRAKDLAELAMPVVYGVLLGSAAALVEGIIAGAGLLPAGAATATTQLLAGSVGTAAGVIIARSVPAIRRLTAGESEIALGNIAYGATIDRTRQATIFLASNKDRLPERFQTKLLEQAFEPLPPKGPPPTIDVTPKSQPVMPAARRLPNEKRKSDDEK